ncbi:MAG: hypothetical protein O2897_02310 [bacterium]|nr:hypothetical protein [bacterium]
MNLIFQSVRVSAILAFILQIAACQSQQELVSGLTEREANEILVVLQSQKMSPIKVAVPGRQITYSVTINENTAPKALRILVDNKLPRAVSPGLAAVYPPGGSGLIPTGSEEKAKYLMALQGEIENMFKILPGIVEARVVIVLPDADMIRDINAAPLPATASVALVYNPIDEEGNPSITTEDVKYLVSSAVEGLTPAGVTVVLASNVPIKLIDVINTKHRQTISKQTLPVAMAGTSNFPPSSFETPANLTPVAAAGKTDLALKAVDKTAAEKKSNFLLWLFAFLAVVGIVLGGFVLIRAISLRGKFNALQNSMANNGSVPAAGSNTNAAASESPQAGA